MSVSEVQREYHVPYIPLDPQWALRAAISCDFCMKSPSPGTPEAGVGYYRHHYQRLCDLNANFHLRGDESSGGSDAHSCQALNWAPPSQPLCSRGLLVAMERMRHLGVQRDTLGCSHPPLSLNTQGAQHTKGQPVFPKSGPSSKLRGGAL